MTVYEGINNLDDLSMQAGSYEVIYLPCFYEDNNPIDLSEATSYGCTLSVYGDDTAIQVISGTCKAGTINTMQIEILSDYTKDLGDCLLLYRPYLVINGMSKRWQGRIYVGATTPYNV